MNKTDLNNIEDLIKQLDVHIDYLAEKELMYTPSTRWYLAESQIALKRLMKVVKKNDIKDQGII